MKIYPSQNTAAIPSDAKAVLLILKAKAVIPGTSTPPQPKQGESVAPSNTTNYCQIDAKLQQADGNLDGQNHAIHTEEWGPIDYKESRRRIAYTTHIVPLAPDGSFIVSIRKGLYGRCSVDLGISLQGYYR